MGEYKDKDVPVVSVSESTSENVASKIKVSSVGCTVKDQSDDLFIERAVAEGGESCSGDDIMVEVFGSDVYVGGVCTTSRDGENLNVESCYNASVKIDAGLEGNGNSLAGDGRAVGSFGLLAAEVSSGDVLHNRNRGEVASEAIAIVDRTAQESGVLYKIAMNRGVENVKNSLAGSQGEKQVISGDALAESIEQDTEKVSDGVEIPGVLKTLNINEIWNPGIEMPDVCSSATMDGSSGQIQIREEKAAMTIPEDGLKAEVLSEKQSNISATGDVGEMDLSTSVGSVTKIGAIADDPRHVIGKQQVMNGTARGRSGNHVANSVANSVSSCSPNKVPVGSNHLMSEELLNEDMTWDILPLESDVGAKVKIDNQNNDAEQIGSGGGHSEGLALSTGSLTLAERIQVSKYENNFERSAGDDIGREAEAEVKELQQCKSHGKQKMKGIMADFSISKRDVTHEVGVEKQLFEADNLHSCREQDFEVEHEDTDSSRRPDEKDQGLKSKKQMERSAGEDIPRVVVVEKELQQCISHEELKIEFEKPEQQERAEKIDGITTNKDETTFSQRTGAFNAEAASVNRDVLLNSTVHVRNFVDVAVSTRSVPVDTLVALGLPIEVAGQPDNDQRFNFKGCSEKGASAKFSVSERRDVTHATGASELVADAIETYLHEEQDFDVEKEGTLTIQPKINILQSETLLVVHRPCYELPAENYGMFSSPDLVWGKVKSHPWWPGQILDCAVASEMAMKYHKKDSFLVAYFGDRTFAWNEASSLKPFQTYFSQLEKQSHSERFQNAVNCALEEVSRRVQFSLACSCIPQHIYEKIHHQILKNAGIRPEFSRKVGADEATKLGSFHVDKLIKYVKELSRFPTCGSDSLELEIAKAQLLALSHLKGYHSLPEFQFCGGLMESDADSLLFEDRIQAGKVVEHATLIKHNSSSREKLQSQSSLSHKRKHWDGVYPKLKERSLSELSGSVDYPASDSWAGKRQKGTDNCADDLAAQDGSRIIPVAKNSTPSIQKQSFKIGECIRRVANQLTGTHIMKSNSDRFQKLDRRSDISGEGADISFHSFDDAHRGRAINPTEKSSPDELLSQLRLAAQNSFKEYIFLNVIVNFFSDFRNSVVQGQYSGEKLRALDKVSGKRKKYQPTGGSPETFEFDDMNDTYWTDRIIQNGSEEHLKGRGRKRKNQIVLAQPEKPLQENRRPYSRKQYSNGGHPLALDKSVDHAEKNAPAELVLNFSEGRFAPSEVKLNKMFRRFGPIKETETEVDRESGRARVIFKKCSDAEVAFSSAGNFNIFGPTFVNYQLNYTPASFKASPIPTTYDHEMHLDLSTFDQGMQFDLSSHTQEIQSDFHP